MKALLLFVCILSFSIARSQTTDTIAIYDQVFPKTFDYPAKPVIRQIGTPQSQSDIYFNTKGNSIASDKSALIYQAAKRATIVVINNKIYSIDDKEFRQLDQSKVIEMNVVNDETSKTEVKSILFIKTK